MVDLRCKSHQLFARLLDGRLEVVCKNKRCGKQRGVIVRHYFDPITGELIETKKFVDPQAMFSRESQNKQKVG